MLLPPLIKRYNFLASSSKDVWSVPSGTSFCINGGFPSGISQTILGSKAAFNNCLNA
jgi:hypothetical protein